MQTVVRLSVVWLCRRYSSARLQGQPAGLVQDVRNLPTHVECKQSYHLAKASSGLRGSRTTGWMDRRTSRKNSKGVITMII